MIGGHTLPQGLAGGNLAGCACTADAGKRVVDFLLVLIEFFLLALMVVALLKQNLSKSSFSEGVGHFERKLLVDGDVARNSMDH